MTGLQCDHCCAYREVVEMKDTQGRRLVALLKRRAYTCIQLQ